MYIPQSMKKAIANTFYDKEISILSKETSFDVEGGVNTQSSEVIDTFKGNVSFSNCKKIQEDYGLDYDIDISVTTNKALNIDDMIRYDGIVYNVTDVLLSDSHNLIVGKIWQQSL